MSEESAFTRLMNEADKYGRHLGVGREFIAAIYGEDTDWAFIIKVDALHETAGRNLLSRLLSLGGPKPEDRISLEGFVESLPYQGRSSVIQLLKRSGCAKDDMQFLECTRRVRNAFAHDVRSIGMSLLDVIEPRSDRSHLLRVFSYIEDEGYDEVTYVELLRSTDGLLRFAILQHTMALLYIMHAVFPPATR